MSSLTQCLAKDGHCALDSRSINSGLTIIAQQLIEWEFLLPKEPTAGCVRRTLKDCKQISQMAEGIGFLGYCSLIRWLDHLSSGNPFKLTHVSTADTLSVHSISSQQLFSSRSMRYIEGWGKYIELLFSKNGQQALPERLSPIFISKIQFELGGQTIISNEQGSKAKWGFQIDRYICTGCENIINRCRMCANQIHNYYINIIVLINLV